MSLATARSRARSSYRARRRALFLSTIPILGFANFSHATIFTWAVNTAGTPSWMTNTNWTPSSGPPLNAADVALFNATGSSTTIGINFPSISPTIGEISLSAGASRTIGDNTNTSGALTLNGVGGVLIANSSTNLSLTLSPQVAGNSGAMSVLLGASGSIDITNAAASVSISADISDNASTFGLTKTGNGTLALGGANTYAGATTLSAGILAIAGNAATSGSTILSSPLGLAALNINGGSLAASGSARTLVNPLALSNSLVVVGSQRLTLGGAIDLGGSSRSFSNVNTSNGGTFSTILSGVIGGPGSAAAGFTFTGAGNSASLNLAVSGANTYGGSTSVLGGIVNPTASVQMNQDGPFGNASSAITLGDSSGNPAGIVLGAANLSFARPITVAGSTGTAYLGSAVGAGEFSGAITLNKTATLLGVDVLADVVRLLNENGRGW